MENFNNADKLKNNLTEIITSLETAMIVMDMISTTGYKQGEILCRGVDLISNAKEQIYNILIDIN